jgi:hypothetical protein
VATVVDRVQAIVDINTEAGRNKLISHLIYNVILSPLMAALPLMAEGAPRGGVCSSIETMLLERQMAPSDNTYVRVSIFGFLM